MTEEIKAELIAFGNKYFLIPKNTWTPEELGEIYHMYNKLNGTSKRDQGCGSCRRDAITNVRDQWMRAKNSIPPAPKL